MDNREDEELIKYLLGIYYHHAKTGLESDQE